MNQTWLNTSHLMDYDPPEHAESGTWSILSGGLFCMKFTTRIDTDMQASALFDAVASFDRIERLLMRRGVSVKRIDQASEPGCSMGWNLGFDWRGKARSLRLEVTRFDRPERMSMIGTSDAFDLRLDVSVVALSRTTSRLVFEVDARPRTMRARLMVQTAKLARPQLDRKFEQRVRGFLDDMRALA